jgi:pimeloyl-ACP methyl ester carboxylesterase
MSRLGYEKFVILAGDVGCDVAEAIAGRYPDAVLSLHLTDVSQYHFLADLPANLSTDEEAYVRQGRDWQAREGGYMHEPDHQAAHPCGRLGRLPRRPGGMARRKVSELDRLNGDVESAFARDDLLTWVTAYWVTGAIGTSFTPYAEAADKSTMPVAPVVFTIFPKDLVNAPQEFARRHFTVASWHEMPVGGHFAAWEHPQDYAQGVHDAVRIAALD